jgi:threonine/homoserine efflux transporter RhtA
MGAILAKPLLKGIGAVGALSLSFTVAAQLLVLWRRPNLWRYSPFFVSVFCLPSIQPDVFWRNSTPCL